MNANSKVDTADAEPVAAPLPVPVPPTGTQRPRRWGRAGLMMVVPLALAVGGSWWWITGGRWQETENANLRQARVSIASEVPGRIVEVKVDDNAVVTGGEVLFVVDPQPYRIALDQADAALAAARLSVEQLRAGWSQAVAQEKMAASEVEYYRGELDRQTALTDKGVSTKANLDSARRDLSKATDAHAAAMETVAGALAALGGDASIATDGHPSVQAALAQREKAAWQLGLTTVTAPADGIVAQASSFRTGQFVAAGTPLFSLVETGRNWVEANFKETQLTNMKLGQAAEVTIDTYPDRPLHATVEAIGAGTGAEFSLLPAQNATGNWVKVTQRIPVRLRIDSGDADLLLRTGMSASVAVDTGHGRGVPQLFAGLFGARAEAAE